jgi:hypothetical protein
VWQTTTILLIEAIKQQMFAGQINARIGNRSRATAARFFHPSNNE